MKQGEIITYRLANPYAAPLQVKATNAQEAAEAIALIRYGMGVAVGSHFEPRSGGERVVVYEARRGIWSSSRCVGLFEIEALA